MVTGLKPSGLLPLPDILEDVFEGVFDCVILRFIYHPRHYSAINRLKCADYIGALCKLSLRKLSLRKLYGAKNDACHSFYYLWLLSMDTIYVMIDGYYLCPLPFHIVIAI